MKLPNRGFSLLELLLAAAILAFVLSGLLLVFVSCMVLNETNRNLTLAYTAIQAEMEEIKNAGFDNLFVVCPSPHPADSFCDDDTFSLNGFASGKSQVRIKISEEGSDLKKVRIIACFMSRNRLIGDDINNCQSSPAELVTLIAK